MHSSKKVISAILVLIFIFTGMPIQYPGNIAGTKVHAEEGVLSDFEAVISDRSWLTFDRIFSASDYLYNPDDRYNLDDPLGYYDYSVSSVTNDVYMPVAAPNGSIINWISSNEEIIDLTGKVTRSGYLQGASAVKLTAAFTKGTEYLNVNYKVQVSPLDPTSDEQAVLDYKLLLEELAETEGWQNPEGVTGSQITLPKEVVNGSTISWTSSNGALIDPVDGAINRPSYSSFNYYYRESLPVTLTATISKGTAEVVISFDMLITSPLEKTPEDQLALDDYIWVNSMISAEDWGIWSGYEGERFTFPASGLYGSAISWYTDHPEVIGPDGTINRPSTSEGDSYIYVSFTISRGPSIKLNGGFYTMISADRDQEEVALDKEWLTQELILDGNSADAVRVRLNLPTLGPNHSSISWSFSSEGIITSTGAVMRPTEAQGDQTVTLTATISRRDFQDVKTFSVIVNTSNTEEEVNLLQADMEWLFPYIFYGTFPDDYRHDIIELPSVGPSGSAISWASSHPEIVSANGGKVNNPPFSYAMGNVPVTLTATISRRDTVSQQTQVVNIYPQYPTSEDRVAKYKDEMTDISILYGNSADNVKTDLRLLTNSGSNYFGDMPIGDCTLQWTSSHPEIIDPDGTVTRPPKGQASVPVTLTVAISHEEAYDTRTFNFIVTPVEEFPLAINYDNFSNTDRLQFNGASGVINTAGREGNPTSALQFISGPGATGGSVFTKNRVRLGEDLSFSTAFSFRNLNPNQYEDINRKGGFTFTLQAADSMAYAQTLDDESIKPSLSIAFITSRTQYSSGQSTTRILGVSTSAFFNGNYSNSTNGWYIGGTRTDLPSYYYNAWIEYNGTEKVLEVWCSSNDERPGPYNSHLRVENVNLSQILTSAGDGLAVEDVRDVYAGFMGSFGDAQDNSEIYDWYLKNDSMPIDHKPYDFYDVSKVALSASPSGEILHSTVTALVSGAGGPVTGMPVEFSTDFGSLDNFTVLTDASGNATVTLSAEHTGIAHVKAVTRGGAMDKTEAQLAATDSDCVAFDAEWLQNGAGRSLLLNGNTAFDNMSTALRLYAVGPNGSTISWSSDNTHINAEDGTVTLPSAEEGNQLVTLTAALNKGIATGTETFNLTVKVPDTSIVPADSMWLTDDLILNGSSALNNVRGNLSMPDTGLYGSAISWTSTDTNIVALNGTVVSPTYTKGDQTVTLTAVISKGSVEITKTYTLTVKALNPTDLEAVTMDSAFLDSLWLTGGSILNGNEGPDNITGNLILPLSGPKDTVIIWESSNMDVISITGAVTQPAFSQGKKKVILTATVSRGSKDTQKTFEVTVMALPQTETEALAADIKWLDISLTLGQNISAFSIKENLMLPSSAPNGSSITWVSDMPRVISASGIVIRPEYLEGHRTVSLTATFDKGSLQESIVFTYTVLALPDKTPPGITSMMVTGNSTILGNYEVPFDTNPVLRWNTDSISITFNEELSYHIYSSQNISIIGPDAPAFYATRWKNKIIIYLKNHLKPGANYELVVPSSYIYDKFGNQPVEDVKLQVSVEEKPLRIIEVVSSAPQDKAKDVPLDTSQVSFKFNYSDIAKGEAFDSIILSTKTGIAVPLRSRVLSSDTVTMILNTPLKTGVVYEMVIPAGAVRDRYTNESTAKTIQFRARTNGALPVINSAYPSDGQIGVDIHQNLEMFFSKALRPEDSRPQLRDDQGNLVAVYFSNLMVSQSRGIITPYKPLKPNTVYTLSGPYESAENPSELEFSQSFTTGDNGLGIIKHSPEYGAKDIPINGSIEIEFVDSVQKDQAFADIQFLDSENNPVDFTSEERGSKAILTPVSDLKSAETYTVHIPAGAYKSASDETNDDYKFFFTNAKRLEPTSRLVDSLSIWLVGKTLQFNADRLESYFRTAKYEIDSYEWNFSDGSSTEAKNASHIFNEPGDYLVKLKIRDNRGFSYEFEWTVAIIPLKDIEISVSRNRSNNLYIASGWPIPAISYNVRLECEKIFVPGENIKVQLYKNGKLEETKKYENLTAGSTDNSYAFTFTPESSFIGNYEVVFTYTCSDGSVVTAREPIIIQPRGATSFLRVQLYNRRSGETYHDADYLNVIVDGNKKVAVREWVDSINEYVYTVKEEFPILRYYKFGLEGFQENSSDFGIIFNVGNLGDFYKNPPVKPGYPVGFGIEKLVSTDIFKRYYIQGVDIGEATFAVQGDWRGLDPGYYELQTDDGRLSWKNSTGEFKLRPGRDLQVGDTLMLRMVSKNGVKTNWLIYNVQVLPKPTVLGREMDVRMVDGTYQLSLPAMFNGLMGDSIPLLNSIPFLDGGNFGIGSDMPTFVGVVYKQVGIPKVIMDFSGEAGYKQEKKTTMPANKKSSIKKIKSVGYEVDIAVDGVLQLEYDDKSQKWNMKFIVIDMDGYGGKFWSSGYKIGGIIGVEGKLEMGVGVGGSLMIDKRDGSAREYSGIIRIRPEVTASVTGSYGLGDVVGYVTGYIPAEIHIPTGYIEAEVGVRAKVIASFLTYSETLYSKELYKAHWDNGKESIDIKRMGLMALPSEIDFGESSGLEPMDREYLNRESVWLAGNVMEEPMQKAGTGASMRGFGLMSLEAVVAEEPNPQIDVLMKNIYPKPEVQLVQTGSEQWLVWVDDNPERDAINRTQIRYSVLKDGAWSEPLWLDGNGTADFSPTVASMVNGPMIAWQNISRTVSEEEGLSAMLENSEISVTGSVYSSDGSPHIIRLTQDDKLDHSPKLAADGNKALLIWTKSEGLGFAPGWDTVSLQAPENSDSLYFSVWDGSSWSNPAEVQGSLPTVLDSSLAMHGDESLLLYTLDMDNDLSTTEDREVFARAYDGIAWGKAVRISDNQLSDISPKAAYLDGEWIITWLRDGNILYKEGLQGEAKAGEFLENVQSDYKLTVNEGANPQAALVYSKSGGNGAQGLSASFYDKNKGLWSGEIPLAEAVGFIHYFSPAFDADGKLNLAYSQAEIITEAITEVIDGVEQLVEQANISDKVDLYMLTYRPVHDLAFEEEDGLQLSTEIPLPGTVVTVFVTVRNNGDFAENAAVALYDGNPAAGGKEVASANKKLIPARSSTEVELEWLVPQEERVEYVLYAVVSPEESVSENVVSNNTISLKITTADIAVTGAEHENLAKEDYLVNTVIINRGSRILKDIEVKLELTQNGRVLKTASIKQLEPGHEFPLSFLISAQGLEKDESGKINLALRAVLPDGVQENFTSNNVTEFTLKPASIVVDGAAPGQNDAQVVIDTAMTLSFNMNVLQGAGFDQITLEDEDLNVIIVARSLEGETLTLTPLNPLANNTQYILTVPVDALRDTYGHTMEELYSISFTTMATSPEIIFAYPGDGMGETALDTDIRLQFNQNVAQGPAFEDISMYGSDDAEISVTASIEGEWLNILPAGGLKGDTTYYLTIPRGSMVNVIGEAQQENYVLEFSTAGSDEIDDADSDDGNDADNEDSDKTDVKTGLYKAIINLSGSMRNVELPITVSLDTGIATVSLEKLADEIFMGDENAVMSIPSIPGVNTYTMEMSATSLSGPYGKASLTFNTGVGSVLIRSGMLSGMRDIEGKTASINISAGDKTKLPEAIRAAIGNHPLVQLTLTLDGKQADWSNPAAPVTVSIPYKPTAAELANPESIIIWYIDGSSRLIPVSNGHYDPATGTVTFTTDHFSYYAVGYNKVSFNDIATTAWYYKAVSFIAARNITMGTNNGNYSPAEKLTRGQFITLLMRAYGIDSDANPVDNFADAGNTYYTGYIAAAKRLAISNGVGNNLFAPEKEITRQEMFTLLYNALKVVDCLPEGNTGKILSDFIDAGQINSWARDAMTLLVKTGTIGGNAGMLTPTDLMTRAEMAQVLYNLLSK